MSDAHALTPREQAALSQLERETERTDPRLARCLRSGRIGLVGFSPLRWSPVVYLIVGGLLCVVGVGLDVGSAVFWGTAALASAVWRSRSARRVLRSAWDAWSRTVDGSV
ncbi:MAG TPA: DUF3040 domain-containing protein [Kineosporiaceae bacterium]